MKRQKHFDRIRLLLLAATILTTYGMSIKFILKASDFKSKWYPLLFSLEGLSLIYFFLINVRRGYIDYSKVDFSLKKASFSKRYCGICNHLKPERAHHCSTCGRCVKKMDHHCMWMSVCVNYDNHGDFVRFLFFTSLASLYISLCYIYNLFLFYKGKVEFPKRSIVLLCIFLLISLGLWIIPSIIFKVQMKLILQNITFLEEMACYDDDGNNYGTFSRYDKGPLSNLKEVFGPPWFLFLWKPQGDGISYIPNGNSPEPMYYFEYV